MYRRCLEPALVTVAPSSAAAAAADMRLPTWADGGVTVGPAKVVRSTRRVFESASFGSQTVSCFVRSARTFLHPGQPLGGPAVWRVSACTYYRCRIR
ncbi:hypothetical protein HPB50_023227 [Hyalomma asiaticum]|uniref:Uncharacterized protein n=1 Tax=Hyalomma asiaticum TaxID=266040 RepID=A0ACB7SPD0_HYAAI|nr:hypothetical protein HPB50_023227 [Hyalomma asiaticum]